MFEILGLADVRRDLWAILDQAPAEVPALRAALIGGVVDGHRYFGEYRCLIGTLATARGCTLAELSICFDRVRPAEAWFYPIRPGDEPGENGEGPRRAATAVRWIDKWTRARA